MAKKPKGLLLATMEPQPEFHEEYHDWYDTEHLPERKATRGFLTARRYVCVDGWPRYMAFYDLASVDVLSSPGYRAYTGANLSPWSRRLLPRVLGEYRMVADLIYPADAVSVAPGDIGTMVVIRFAGVRKGGEAGIVAGLRKRFEALAQVRQLRVFRAHDAGERECLGILELRAPLADLSLEPKLFGARAGTVRMVNTYVPYWRKGHG